MQRKWVNLWTWCLFFTKLGAMASQNRKKERVAFQTEEKVIEEGKTSQQKEGRLNMQACTNYARPCMMSYPTSTWLSEAFKPTRWLLVFFHSGDEMKVGSTTTSRESSSLTSLASPCPLTACVFTVTPFSFSSRNSTRKSYFLARQPLFSSALIDYPQEE